MAVTVDQASLAPTAGSTGKGHAGSTLQNVSYNTSAAVAAGALIVQVVHRFRGGGGGTYTGTGGSLTWTTIHSVTSGDIGIYLIAAFAPSGLASGTSIGVNSTVNNNDYTITAASYLGIDSSGTVSDAVRAFGGAATASSSNWGTGTIGGNAGDAYIGGAGGDGTLRTSTPGGDSVERNDFNSSTTSGSVTLIDDLDGSASDTIAGTWSGTLSNVAIGAAFIPAAGSSSVTSDREVTYDVQNAVTSSRQVSWDVQNSVVSTRTASWDVQNAVTSSRQVPWDVQGTVVSDREVTYDVENANPVSTRDVSWDVQNAVVSSRQVDWDVQNAVVSSRTVSYDVINAVTSSRLVRYDVGTVEAPNGDLLLLGLA